MQKKTNKEYQKFQNHVKQLLKDFERNREWADIGNWLSRLQPLISANKFPDFPHKINMAKRLAQCLNISLPAGIHSGALNVYNTILNNFGNKSELRPLMSIGLFPFFQYSSSNLKLQLLKIFDRHFTNDHECIQMIVSLMNTLLTGLNENNEQLAKKIYTLCDKIANNYGRIWIDGAVWVNILKSPKVRSAAFKYFKKSFKDRDKQKKIVQNLSIQQKLLHDQVQSVQKQEVFIKQIENSTQGEKQLLSQLSKLQGLEDDHKTRFPNFSTLVINAISVCLQGPHNDNYVRREALDLMIFYLKLENKVVISENDAIQLITVVLGTTKLNQFSLTRRVYTYLFGQPDSDGQYHIDEQERGYELRLLKKSLQKLLIISEPTLSQKNNNETVLMIIETLLKDHQALADIIFPSLAYKILNFLRKSKISHKIMYQFYNNVILLRIENYNSACLKQFLVEESIQDEQYADDTFKTIEFYFSLKLKADESSQKQKVLQVTRTIEGLLKYLELSKCSNVKVSVKALDLCYRLLQNSKSAETVLSQQSIQTLDLLIQSKPTNSIYSGLLILRPLPSKQTLLPYINETSLAIVCISNLLELSAEKLEQSERKALFYAIFKLLNCHLWEEQAIQFIQCFKNKYPKQFKLYINQVEPTEWLIYWKNMNGEVQEGVIRMLSNLDNQNPLLRHLSKKWVQDSKTIVSKIVDPIYHQFILDNEQKSNDRQILDSKIIYKMIQNMFLILKSEFVTYFFIQKEKYLIPLTAHIYKCLKIENQDIKSQSLVMLQFLLERANTLEQKITFLQLTLGQSLIVLRKAIENNESYLREIQILSYFKAVADLFPSFRQNKQKGHILKKLIQQTELFIVLSDGMKETSVGYVRTLYMDLLQYSSQTLARYSEDKQFVSKILTTILQKLFLMLRQTDVTYLEQIIQGKTISSVGNNRRKRSSVYKSIQQSHITDTQFNVETKYAQVIEIWNLIKFFVKISIENKVHDLPIGQLLSIILQSFPFSYLRYDQISPQLITQQYQILQQEIKNVTGLKKQVLQIFQTLWQNYQEKIINFLIDKGDPRVLIHGSVDPNAVIKAILKSKSHHRTTKYFKQAKFSLPKGVLHFNSQVLIIQNQVCYFFYLYILFCNLSLIKNKKVANFVYSALTLIKHFKGSSHIQIKLWAIQTIYCLSERIPFRDLHLENNKIKTDFQQMIKQLLEQLTLVGTKSKNFTHKFQIKTGLFSIFSKEQKQSSLYDFIKIYPPSVFKMSSEYQIKMKNKNSDNVVHIQDEIQHFLFAKCGNQTESGFIDYLSIVTIKTLTSIYMKLLINVYEHDGTRIPQLVKEHLNLMLPLCEDKSDRNQVYIENVTEFLHGILNIASLKAEIIKLSRKNILDIFNGDDFFKCTKNTLNHWKFVIDYCTEGHDMLGDLLTGKNLFQLWKNKTQITRQKIKSFERVCFLIYSGRIDKYENKLRTVLQQLIEVLKQENPSPALLILILFCIRILFIRLSQNTLNRIFRSIWPSLIALLIQIFTRETFSKNNNLLLAGLKVIELIHALELQQFNIHKWIFIFDYFGIRLDTQTQQEQKIHNSDKILTPFCFKPILTAFLPQNKFKCSYMSEEWPQKHHEITRRKLVVKQSNIDSEQQLRNHAFILLQYMIDLNQKRVYTVREQIQDIIEADFISLDDYIFQLK